MLTFDEKQTKPKKVLKKAVTICAESEKNGMKQTMNKKWRQRELNKKWMEIRTHHVKEKKSI